MNNTTPPAVDVLLKTAPQMQKHEIITWATLFSVEAFFIVIGNLFTIVVFCYTNMRQNRAFCFLLNLAVADLMVGALSMPLFVTVFVGFFTGDFNHVNSQSLYAAHRFLDAFAGFIAIFSLVLVSLERLYAVVFALRHRAAKIPSYIAWVAATWLLALAVPLLGMVPSSFAHKIAFYLYLVCHSTALIIICIAYVVVWRWVVCHRINSVSRPRCHRDRRLARTLAIVTAVSLVAWIPFQLIHYLQYLCKTCPSIPNTPLYTSKLMHYGNSLVNPILYCFRIPEFSSTAKKLLIRMRMRRPSENSLPVELDEPNEPNDKLDDVDTIDSMFKSPASM